MILVPAAGEHLVDVGHRLERLAADEEDGDAYEHLHELGVAVALLRLPLPPGGGEEAAPPGHGRDRAADSLRRESQRLVMSLHT